MVLVVRRHVVKFALLPITGPFLLELVVVVNYGVSIAIKHGSSDDVQLPRPQPAQYHIRELFPSSLVLRCRGQGVADEVRHAAQGAVAGETWGGRGLV